MFHPDATVCQLAVRLKPFSLTSSRSASPPRCSASRMNCKQSSTNAQIPKMTSTGPRGFWNTWSAPWRTRWVSGTASWCSAQRAVPADNLSFPQEVNSNACSCESYSEEPFPEFLNAMETLVQRFNSKARQNQQRWRDPERTSESLGQSVCQSVSLSDVGSLMTVEFYQRRPRGCICEHCWKNSLPTNYYIL